MNRIQAKRLWRSRVDTWQTWAETLTRRILAIEDPVLQHAVAGIIDSIASGYGSIAVERIEDRFRLVGFIVDDEAQLALKRGMESFGTEADMARKIIEADLWLRKNIVGCSVFHVAWSVGRLKDITPEDMNRRRPRLIFIDDVVYDITAGKFLGVPLAQGGFYRPA